MPCRRLLSLLSLSLAVTSALGQASKRPIGITADLTEAPRKLFHAEIDLPVHAGPLALITPEWIPGAHGPDGPVRNITGVVFTADGKTLPWHRDPVNTFEYHLVVPAGVTTLHAHLDCIYSRATRTTATLEWEALMLYPANTPVHDIAIQPTVIVPTGWGIGTSLTPVTPYDPQHPAGGKVGYAPTTVELLEDSPIMTGANFHEYALAPDVTPKHYIDFIGTQPSDVEVSPEVLAKLSHLVHEGLAMYGPPHYTSYHFLVYLIKGNGGGGLEHHESSDNTLPSGSLSHDDTLLVYGDVLPHEFTHSWNGKYRRPAGLATPDYATPMRDDLLWIYEGLTNYMGNVLGARIGYLSPEQYRDYLALTAAEMDNTSGRAWRSVEDTTFDSAMPRGNGGNAWNSWKRGSDYYPEGDLVWLDVDTTIRKLTADKRSLRDFLRIYLQKGGSGVARVEPYQLDEIVADLNKVAPNDWAGFFQKRIYEVNPHVNVEGIEQGGYKLVYTDEPNDYVKTILTHRFDDEFWFTVGLQVSNDGTVDDVRMGSPADKAKLAPGQKITVIDGKVFSREQLHAAIKAGKTSTAPMQLSIQNEDIVTPATLDYHDGERYPRLVRIEGTPDYLTEIAKPLTP